MKQQARAQAALEAATWLGDLRQARATVAATLRAYPEILRHAWAPEYVREVLRSARPAITESPVAAARELCGHIKPAMRDGNIRTRFWVRETIAWLWTEEARALNSGPQANNRHAAYAAACAVASAPWYLWCPALVRVVICLVFGRDA